MDGTFFIEFARPNDEIDRELNPSRASEIHRKLTAMRVWCRRHTELAYEDCRKKFKVRAGRA
jgi:hypothetical protein